MITIILQAIPQADPLPLPAPLWLLWGLLTLTFVLHIVPMNFVLGGSLIAAAGRLRGSGDEDSRALLHWLAKLAPTMVSAAVTFGVAALLFVQTLYGRLFFSSSILMAWFWLGVVPVLILAYYGTYVLSFKEERLGRLAAPLAILIALMFTAIAFVYTNNMSLALRPETWVAAYQQDAGGTHLNLADKTLIPRFLHMVLGAVAVAGMIVSLYGLAKSGRDEVHGNWAMRHGAIWFVAPTVVNLLTGLWWIAALPREVMFRFAGRNPVATWSLTLGVLFGVSALAMMIGAMNASDPGRLVKGSTWSLALTLVAMVVARDQVRQGMLGIAAYEIPAWIEPQWAVIAIFGVLLVAALGLTAWMARLLLRTR